MEYVSFTIEQFVADERFQEWVLRPTDELNRFWDTFLTDHPAKADEVREARRTVLVWRQTGAADVFPQDQEAIWTAIAERVDPATPVIPWRRPWWAGRQGAAAAVVVLLLGLGGWWFNRSPDWVTVSTAYRQTRQLVLPDSSIVTLNAHSSVRYAADLPDRATREIWLTGEAFFSVRHTASNKPFRVHTSKMSVEVLGTEFNVSDRRKVVRVVLEKGEVRVKLTNGPVTATLKPGDLVETQAGTSGLLKRHVKPDAYSSWRQHRWELQQESLGEVALRLEETFGLRVRFENTADRSLKVSGHLPTRDLAVLCDILSETLHRRFEPTDRELIIHSLTSLPSNP